MKITKVLLVVLVGSFMIIGPTYPASISKKEIPSSIPSEIRAEIEKLFSNDSEERARGIWRLGEMGRKAAAAVPFLIELLNNGDSQIQYQAGYALAKIGKPATLPLISMLKDEKSWLLRLYIIYTLGEIGDARAAEYLLIALKDEDPDIRSVAAWGLGKIKDAQALPLLIEALKNDKSWYVRMYTAGALGEIKDLQGVLPLIEALRDCVIEIQETAAWALGEITGRQPYGKDIKEWQDWWEKEKDRLNQ